MIKQTAFNGVYPDHETLMSAARTIYQGLVQQVSATGINVVPISHPSGGEFKVHTNNFIEPHRRHAVDVLAAWHCIT